MVYRLKYVMGTLSTLLLIIASPTPLFQILLYHDPDPDPDPYPECGQCSFSLPYLEEESIIKELLLGEILRVDYRATGCQSQVAGFLLLVTGGGTPDRNNRSKSRNSIKSRN